MTDRNIQQIPGVYKPGEARKEGSAPRRDDLPPRIVLHTTEMVSSTPEKMRKAFAQHPWPPHLWCSFADANAWSYTKKWGSAVRKKKVRDGYDLVCQRIPFDRTAYALRAPKINGMKYETNHAGRHCIQVEIEGYAGDTQNWPDSMLEVLGKQVVAPIVRWLRQNGHPNFELKPYKAVGLASGSFTAEDGVPVTWSAYGDYKVTEKKDKKTGKVVSRKISGYARMSYEDWLHCTGGQEGEWNIATHQQIPKNTHWDCGRMDLGKICEHANAELGAQPTQTADLSKVDEVIGELETTLAKLKSARLALGQTLGA